VQTLAPEPGEQFLDLACGTGAVALLAAETGAETVGLDISPGQLVKARSAAAEAGLDIRFDEGDAQELPYGDAAFDVVASAFGVVFAPSHERAAGELARVVRPGGRLAMTAWPRDPFSELGREYPPGDDPREWGQRERAAELLRDAFELRFEDGEWVVVADSAEELFELVRTSAPPVKAWFEKLDEAGRADAEREYLDFLAGGELRRPYLLVAGRRR